MTKFITKRLFAGSYEVTQKDDPNNRVVDVMQVHYHDGPHWIAAAKWISNVYSDPVPTKREAVKNAQSILTHWDIRGNWKE